MVLVRFRGIAEGGRTMNLHALAVRHRTRDYWTLDQRLFATREAAEAWGAEQWGGVIDIETKVVKLEAAA
jgi:hypothetical protein